MAKDKRRSQATTTKTSSGDASGPSTFPRPDSQQASEGIPPYEDPAAGSAGNAHSAARRDLAHGFSQDSGYSSSGGPAPVHEQASTEARTGQDANAGPPSSDEQLKRDIEEKLRDQPSAQGTAFTIAIEDGIVTLRGDVPSENALRQVTDLVSSVANVRSLKSELKVTPSYD